MLGTPGATATRDAEVPESSAPCSPSYDLTGKVMLLGDSGVGKTCFLIQFKDGAFLSGTFIATVGIDFRNKVVTVDGVRVKLQIWDTAGQERFRSVTHAYYRDAQALLLLYDITNKSSFDNIRAWLTEINEYAQRDVVIMLLGNKSYRPPQRVGSTHSWGERWAGWGRRRASWGQAFLPQSNPSKLPGGCEQRKGDPFRGRGDPGQGVWSSLHGDQRQNRHERGASLSGHCQGAEIQGQAAGR
ncbi:ras-related protein Rab-37 isoform X1 [Elephas maximus indicus]|uniref:ras-related protein Rab-37 isoform X1 n=1 Tax=Elephas maximus indicus TaxID=99487 RepID=UPI0021167FC1|nr:ras-related protein Rab-37 isoform X1 [Elephas maximus indicus]